MPKRPNPFGDIAPLQQKSHISQKHLDQYGCENKKNMKAVFEHTKNLLFQGAKNVSLGMSPTKDENLNRPVPVQKPVTSSVLPGQLRIDQGGSLCTATVNGHQKADMDMDTAENSLGSPELPGLWNKGMLTGQLQISASGQLQPAEPVPSTSGCVSPDTRCQACHCDCGYSLRSCNFCDRRICRTCTRCCERCEGRYCHLCSTVNYDDYTERVFCLLCT